MTQISRDTPLNEITLRKYEKPGKLSGRSLVRMVCLSLGLLQPGDSRDVIVDVLYVLLKARNQNLGLTSSQVVSRVEGARKRARQSMLGTAPSNIRRQLLRLRDLFLVEKDKNTYRITEFLDLSEIFENRVEDFLLESTLKRVKLYLKETDDRFRK
ncbi:MAG: hypothetical protein MAG795_00434 [Candidatus Woesearchaeota archaeon]|nr:hypothetical protein [Candidatus Woesearchaeota archaeon]